MRNGNLKKHYSAKELLDLSLSCLPNSVQGIIYQAKKNGWVTQKRVGKGGGKEYALASLPQEIQTEIRTKFAVSIVKAKPKSLPADLRQVELKTLTEKQREVAGARMALVAQVAQLEQ
ncbi:transposase, partial [Haemophilus influenzae]